MNIDAESIALLSLILRDVPQARQFILCVLARSNQIPGHIKFNPNTEYPTFYGYSNERMPYFLMGKGIIGNVPREGSAKRLISSHYLSYAETVINGAKNWDIHQKLMSVSKFITLDNKTKYKDAEVFLVFRDKAQDYIKEYVIQNKGNISGFLKSKIGRFEFGGKVLSQQEKLAEVDNRNNKTKYQQLLSEIRSSNQTSPQLAQRYEKALEEIKSAGIPQSKRGLEKKWDVLQAIWTVYESNSRADSVLVPIARLAIKGRLVEEIDGIIEGLKNNGCFTRWERKDRWYSLENINHDIFPKIFGDTEKAYKENPSNYQEQNKKDENTLLQKQERAILPSKRELRKKISNIIKIGKFGKKEKTFLRYLAKDFEPKTIEEINKEVIAKAYKALKARVQKKLKNTGFFIETIRPDRWDGKSQYQLKFLTSSVNS